MGKTGDIFNEQVALGHPHETIKLIAEGDRIFSEMIDMLDALGIRKGKEVVGKYYQQLRNPQDTVSGKMWTIIQENSNSELGNIFGNQYQSMAFERPYQLAGFREMELSTQIFLFDAIQKVWKSKF